MGKAEQVVILSADDWVCIFVLIVQMRCPAQGATGDWVMLGLVFKWLHLCEFSLFDTPYGQFSGSLGSWSQCYHSKGSEIDLLLERRFHKWLVKALSEIKTNIQK